MDATGSTAFDNLVRAWLRREDLRSNGAAIGTMVEARRDLDQARLQMARARHH